MRRAWLAWSLLVIAPVAPWTLAAQTTDSVAAVTAHFAFRSSFWLNLHNFLHKEAKRRRGLDDDGPQARGNITSDTIGLRALTAEESHVWERALASYGTVLRRDDDSVVIKVNNGLANAAEAGDLSDTRLGADLRHALLEAAPVYRGVWWPVHDRRNRAWISSTMALLYSIEDTLAAQLARGLGAAWPGEPIRVDITVYATWFGAYSTLSPPHVTLSRSAVAYQGLSGIEALFHEAGHAMLAPVDSALAASAARLGRSVPDDLTHSVLFYTAGEVVRGIEPVHVPNAEAFGTWRRNEVTRRYANWVKRAWQPYLDGRTSFAEAVEQLARRLR